MPIHCCLNLFCKIKKKLLTYCSPCCIFYIAALLGGRILRIRNIAEGHLCAKCLKSADIGSTSAISVSRVRKEELSNKVAAVLLENARLQCLQWFRGGPAACAAGGVTAATHGPAGAAGAAGEGEVLTVAAKSWWIRKRTRVKKQLRLDTLENQALRLEALRWRTAMRLLRCEQTIWIASFDK